MASFDGLSKAKAEQILGMSVVSGSINASGHLILVRANGDTINAGDFTGIVTDVMEEQVTAAVGIAVPGAVAGTKVDKGTISGGMSFSEFNSTNLINALIVATLNGNITISTSNLPSGIRPNTQFAVRLTQDSVGGRTITLSGFKKSQGILQLTPAPNAVDLLVMMYDGTTWFAGMMGADMK